MFTSLLREKTNVFSKVKNRQKSVGKKACTRHISYIFQRRMGIIAIINFILAQEMRKLYERRFERTFRAD
jgi:hypothetical protein